MSCPVAIDTARYYTEQDKKAEYEAAIEERVNELDPADVIEAMNKKERDRLSISLNVFLRGTVESQKHALSDLRHLLRSAAWRQAEEIFAQEMKAASERESMQRFRSRVECWA